MKDNQNRIVRATVELPADLLRQVEAALRRGVAKSRNALLARALSDYLNRLERERIDDEFERMPRDAAYLGIARDIERQWSPTSDEAWRVIDAAEQRFRRIGKRRP